MLLNIRITNLLILLLILALFPRVLMLLGVPKVIAFLHFGVTVVLLTLTFNKAFRFYQIRQLLYAMLALFFVALISTILNAAGAVNFVLCFLMITFLH